MLFSSIFLLAGRPVTCGCIFPRKFCELGQFAGDFGGSTNFGSGGFGVFGIVIGACSIIEKFEISDDDELLSCDMEFRGSIFV